MQGRDSEIAGLLINAMSAVIALEYMDRGFSKKFEGAKRWLVFVYGCVAYFAVVTFLNMTSTFEGLLGLGYGLVLIAYGWIALEGSWGEKTAMGFLWVVIALISAYMMFGAIGIITGSSLNRLLESDDSFRVYSAIATAVIKFSLGRVVLAFFKKKHGGSSPRGDWAMFGAFLLVFVLILGMFRLEQGGLDQRERYYMSLWLLAGFFIIILLLEHFHRKQGQYDRNQREVQFQCSVQQSQKEHMRNLWSMSREMNRLRHDLKGSMDILYRLVKTGQSEEALKFMEQRNIDIQNYQELPEDTGNEGLNAALIKTVEESREKKICFRYVVYGMVKGMDNMDIGLMFYNLLSNAVEACVKCDEPREIDLQIWEKKEGLYCRLENSIKSSVLKENPKLRTEKEDKRHHGFGMESIREIIKKYEGNYTCSEESGLFIQEIVLKYIEK